MWRCVVEAEVSTDLYSLALLLLRQTEAPAVEQKIYCAAGERGPWALIEGQKGQKEHTELKRETLGGAAGADSG